jgi:hypothetical protein
MTGIWDRSVSTDTTLGGRPAAPPPWVTLSAASDPVQVEASHFVDGPPTPRLRLLVHLQNRSLEPIEDCRLLARSAGTVCLPVAILSPCLTRRLLASCNPELRFCDMATLADGVAVSQPTSRSFVEIPVRLPHVRVYTGRDSGSCVSSAKRLSCAVCRPLLLARKLNWSSASTSWLSSGEFTPPCSHYRHTMRHATPRKTCGCGRHSAQLQLIQADKPDGRIRPRRDHRTVLCQPHSLPLRELLHAGGRVSSRCLCRCREERARCVAERWAWVQIPQLAWRASSGSGPGWRTAAATRRG